MVTNMIQWHCLAGQIQPTGHRLPTPDVDTDMCGQKILVWDRFWKRWIQFQRL